MSLSSCLCHSLAKAMWGSGAGAVEVNWKQEKAKYSWCEYPEGMPKPRLLPSEIWRRGAPGDSVGPRYRQSQNNQHVAEHPGAAPEIFQIHHGLVLLSPHPCASPVTAPTFRWPEVALDVVWISHCVTLGYNVKYLTTVALIERAPWSFSNLALWTHGVGWLLVCVGGGGDSPVYCGMLSSSLPPPCQGTTHPSSGGDHKCL